MVGTNARCYACTQLPRGEICEKCQQKQQAEGAAQNDEEGERMSVAEVTGYLTAVAWLHRPGIKAATYQLDDGSEVIIHRKEETL